MPDDAFYKHVPAIRDIQWTRARVLEVHPDYLTHYGHLVGKEIEAEFEHSTPKDRWQSFPYKYEKELSYVIAKIERI